MGDAVVHGRAGAEMHLTPAIGGRAAGCCASFLPSSAVELRLRNVIVFPLTGGFPRTICGVVYQGFDRTTGCQFSFTCDGSIRRRTKHFGWSAARRVASEALAGHVFADVGRATHYHADWIVPYWRDSMTKVAKVDTHLFYVRL